ncbi:MAG: ZIP family metal transporter [Candidatus Saccharibacteria bacterium]|nr:ZIP family metal transporter [Candidatus Saccharibacteria bacterium]
MATLAQVILFAFLGGVVSLVGGLLLLSNKKFAKALEAYGMPFAAGALLAAVFLDLLTDGIEEAPAGTVLTATMVGIFIFFFAERFLRWFHHHHQHGSPDPSVSLIVAGDTIHNALDGIAIAAAFLVSVPTGIVTTIAVAAHEIPQEIGDFGLLLSKGVKRSKVLLINFISALATVVTAIITFQLGSNTKLPLGVLLGVSAGFLLYIALSDIIPTIHEKSTNKRLFELQPFLMILGACLVALAIQIARHVAE